MTPGTAPVAVSQPLPGEVISAMWNPGRTALLVVVRTGPGSTQIFVVYLNGRIADVTGQARGSTAVHWSR